MDIELTRQDLARQEPFESELYSRSYALYAVLPQKPIKPRPPYLVGTSMDAQKWEWSVAVIATLIMDMAS